jgi:hypothetical protein
MLLVFDMDAISVGIALEVPRAPAPFEPRLPGVVAFFGCDEKINKRGWFVH